MTDHKAPAEQQPVDASIPEGELVADDDTIIGSALKWSAIAVLVIGLGVAAAVWAVRHKPAPPPPVATTLVAPRAMESPVDPPQVAFTDITAQAGIDFVHVNGATGDKLMPETMGSGCAFFDYDNDGDQDLLLINSTYWPDKRPLDATTPTMALFRNDGSGQFENVTAGSGLDVGFYGTGVAVGDYDNDGFTDVFIAALGPNHLFRNVNGHFEDVTASANVAGEANEWSTSAAFIDYDNDGDLDLFVCNYIRWSREIDFSVDYRLVGVGRAYGPPMNFEGTYPYLYRNEGGGRFTDVSADGGVRVKNPATGKPMAKSLGVAPIDVDRDGWIDLMIANDTVAKFFYHNRAGAEGPVFEETGALYGLAYDRDGNATGAMGIDAGQYRNNDDLGIFIGNFANEMTSLYVSQGVSTLFADEAISEGIGAPSRLMLKFGLFLFDYDLDGRLDLLQVNGHLEDEINKVQSSQHYEQPAQLFWNCGRGFDKCFIHVPAEQTGDLSKPAVARGSSYADIDGDGDLDVIVTEVARRPRLLRNDQRLGNHWVRLKLVGATANRDAIGARVECTLGDDKITRQVMPTRGYESQVELPITLGLGKRDRIETMQITWPGGQVQQVTDLSAGKTHVIRQGNGVPEVTSAGR